MLSHHHLLDRHVYIQKVSDFVAVLDGFDFKPFDYDSYRGRIGDHNCFIFFYPADDICTLSVITNGNDETFHYPQPADLAQKLSQLKNPVHANA